MSSHLVRFVGKSDTGARAMTTTMMMKLMKLMKRRKRRKRRRKRRRGV